MTDPTQCLASRVTNYVKYRPSYPTAIIDLVAAECGLTPDSIVADIGSGTGLLAELFLKAGNHVLGIEPTLMREAGEQLLRGYEHDLKLRLADGRRDNCWHEREMRNARHGITLSKRCRLQLLHNSLSKIDHGQT